MENQNAILVDWKNVRKTISKQLVVIDVTGVEDKQPFIKNLSSVCDEYKRSYDKISVKIISEGNKELLVLEGIRKETEEEFKNRMGIKTETSWVDQYSKLTGSSVKESKDEMMKMLQNGQPLTPEEWILEKKKQIESFFNVGKNKG